MRLHHLGFVTRSLPQLERRLSAEGAEPTTGPIEDPVQRVVVQFFRQAGSGELWEGVAPLGGPEGEADSPLRARLARGGGLDHVCYDLEENDGPLESVVEAERARGGQVVCPPVFAVAFQRRIAFVFRRSGRLVEFVEREP